MKAKNRILYLDCFSGASGDMLLGVFVSLGVSLNAITDQLKKVLSTSFQLECKNVIRSGIAGTHVSVVVPHQHDDHDKYDHQHQTFASIRDLILQSGLKSAVKKRSLAIFEKLARAESIIHHGVHQDNFENVHFHEVGETDALVDIIGSVVALDLLEVDVLYASPLSVGKGGIIQSQHGMLPVPAPATLEMLKGIPMRPGFVNAEILTPTGAAIITTLSQGFIALPPMKIESIGYGAGTKDFSGFPNVLRGILGTSDHDSTSFIYDDIQMIQTNIDDVSPVIFDTLFEHLFLAHAVDVSITSIQMKKNRPGFMLTVLCKLENVEALSEIIFRHTTTLGLRFFQAGRYILNRKIFLINTTFGPVHVKVSYNLQNEVYHVSPEYDDMKTIGQKNKLPIREVYNAISKSLSDYSQFPL